MATGKVERWAVITPSGMVFPYNKRNIAEAMLPNYITGSRVGLVREVDPAHDAAVSRLVEAENKRLRELLRRIADCDWLPEHDGMSVHEIARAALGETT